MSSEAWRLVPTKRTRPPRATVSLTTCSARRKHRNGLSQIDDVDVVTIAENVRLHLRVPAMGLVAEVNTSFQKLAHRKIQAMPCL